MPYENLLRTPSPDQNSLSYYENIIWERHHPHLPLGELFRLGVDKPIIILALPAGSTWPDDVKELLMLWGKRR